MFGAAMIKLRRSDIGQGFAVARLALALSGRSRAGLVGLAGLAAATLALGGGTAFSATAPGVAYGGKTSQHDQVFFLLSTTRHSVSRIALDWDASCHGVDDFTVGATLGVVRIKADGSFAKTQTTTEEGDKPSWSDHWTEQIAGRVASDRITGTFHGHVATRRSDGSLVGECDSGTVTFTALQ
jgi:hypothetical protein